MTDTARLLSRGADLARRTEQVLAQSAMVREEAVRAMETAADVEDELAGVLDELASSGPRAAVRLRRLADEARRQAERTRRWVQEHEAQTAHDRPGHGSETPGADALRARGAGVAQSVARTHDEIAAVMRHLAGQRPQRADHLMTLSQEARHRARRCRAWAQDLSA